MRNIDLVVIHCSASDNPADDSIEALHKLHTSPRSVSIKWGEYDAHGKEWSDIGYHFFITKDGKLHKCRPLHKKGAHCLGFNSWSIGICLSGNTDFTSKQFKTLRKLREELEWYFGELLYKPHNALNKHKTCPNFDLEDVWTN